MSELLRSERHGPVTRLVLNDNATRNSLSTQMLAMLATQLDRATEDTSTSVLIMAAEGKAFSSGHNLKELTAHRKDADHGAEFFHDTFAACSKVMEAIKQHRCVTIAEVNGLASAAGCQLVASCDLAYASPSASFCTPGVNIGLFCSTPMVPLSRTVSQKHAMEMLLTGDTFSAEHAEKIGLINAVIPTENLTSQVLAIAQKISAKSQSAIAYGKQAFTQQLAMPLGEAYSKMSEIMTRNMLAPSACEGIDAVIEKRKPKWP